MLNVDVFASSVLVSESSFTSVSETSFDCGASVSVVSTSTFS